MSQLKNNIIANFLGRGWTIIMGMAFIPLYIKFMGIESYGLVGLFGTIQTFSSLLDMGLSSALNRELAMLSGAANGKQESRDLVRTLEIIYWGITAIIALCIMAVSPLISNSWIKAEHLSPGTIQLALTLMGVVIACQFPVSFYSGGLLGLQKQVLLSGLSVTVATLRGIGMVLVLWLISPTIQAFFIWQAAVSLLQTMIVSVSLWRSLPKTLSPPRFKKDLFLRVWRFAAGMTGISLVSIVLMQADKVILSTMLTLEDFGYYNLAGTVASGVGLVTSPIFTPVFPRFSQLVSQNKEVELIALYHKTCQFLSLLLIPIAVILSLFSKDILLLWTGNPVVAEKAYLLVSALTIGTSLNGLMNVPYALQLAYGWTKLAFYINLVAIAILIPLMFLLTTYYGAIGAAVVWVILNSGYVLIGIQIMHTKLLKKEMFKWYYQDIIQPLIGVVSVGFLAQLIVKHEKIPVNLYTLFLILIITFLSSVLMTDIGRNQIKSMVQKRF
jgi:O-antigen/teichoic acid export membrane protein